MGAVRDTSHPFDPEAPLLASGTRFVRRHATPHWRGAAVARGVAGTLLALVLCSLGKPPEQRLFAERRDAYARVLESCGRKKACIIGPSVAAHDSSFADVRLLPATTHFRSRWKENQYDYVRVWIAPSENVPLSRPENRYVVRDA